VLEYPTLSECAFMTLHCTIWSICGNLLKKLRHSSNNLMRHPFPLEPSQYLYPSITLESNPLNAVHPVHASLVVEFLSLHPSSLLWRGARELSTCTWSSCEHSGNKFNQDNFHRQTYDSMSSHGVHLLPEHRHQQAAGYQAIIAIGTSTVQR